MAATCPWGLDGTRILQSEQVVRKAGVLQVAAVSFANAATSSIGDDLIAWIQNRDDPYARREAQDEYRAVILYGQAYHPKTVFVFTILGAVISVVGMLAMWIAVRETKRFEAFKVVFFIELVEFGLFEGFQKFTTGELQISWEDFGVVLLTAFVLGTFTSFKVKG